jgi:hypothetical protein
MHRGNTIRSLFKDNISALGLGKPTAGAVWNSLFIGNVNYAISTNHAVTIVNCVIDGADKVGQIGVKYPDASGSIPKILNSIILDCVVGVQGVIDGADELCAIYNSCFYLNTTDFTQGAAARTGNIYVDPLFLDRDNQDYGIGTLSPCKEAGMDLKLFDYYTSTAARVDIGLLQWGRSQAGTGNIGAPMGFSTER